MRTILISIKPIYAERILRGGKSYELRRRRIAASTGDLVVLYASAPMKAVIGCFTAGLTHSAGPKSIWACRDEMSLGIDEHSFFEYFKGVDEAWALGCLEPSRLAPVPLSVLRNRIPGFQPPQSWMHWHQPAHLLTDPVCDGATEGK